MRLLSFLIAVCMVVASEAFGQNRFYRQYWMEYEGRINNNRPDGERTRVSDSGMRTSEAWHARFETQVNGLALIRISDTIRHIERAELFCEMWGGHPGTANKRVQINGGRVYPLPSGGTQQGHCEYIFARIPVDHRELVRGYNALQFACDRGGSFWGHYILEQIAVVAWLKTDAPELLHSGINGFRAMPVVAEKILGEDVRVGLDYPDNFAQQIEAVHFFARYEGYDQSGSGDVYQWHGELMNRRYSGHLGSDSVAPFEVIWDTRMVPDQSGPMAIRAVVELRGGWFYKSEALTGLSFPASRPWVRMYHCASLPVPFWSRDNQLRTAVIELPAGMPPIERAELHVRNWDGGGGSVKEPFKFNSVAYPITGGDAPHRLIYTVNQGEPSNLQTGFNAIELLSDTEHHGIEICLPGPCLIVRYK